MGKFTLSNNIKIDEKIQKDMDIIRDEILKEITPISILLTGSFGRGEGSVLMLNDKIYPLKDYDILLIFKDKIPKFDGKKIEENIFKKLHYSLPKDRNFLFSDFVISIELTTIKNLKSYAHISAYDIKNGSIVIFGKNIKNEMLQRIEDISLSSGLHVLLMKTIGLLGHFSTEYFDNPPNGSKKLYMCYECGKTYIEIGTALCLLGKVFKPTYLERSTIIKSDYTRIFPELAKILPDLPEKIDFFTNLKLNPDFQYYDSIDSINLWFQTRDDLGIVIQYYSQEYFGILKYNDWINFSNDFYKKAKKDYFKDIWIYYLNKNYAVSNKYLVMLVNLFYQKYTTIQYVFELGKRRKFISRCFLESPVLKIYSLAPAVLFCINKENTLNLDLLKYCNNELQTIFPQDKLSFDDNKNWEFLRKNLITASELYQGLW